MTYVMTATRVNETTKTTSTRYEPVGITNIQIIIKENAKMVHTIKIGDKNEDTKKTSTRYG
jgi:hypothetical protein